MSAPKRIAVFTGGGDRPGLNAVIRAVVKRSLHHGYEADLLHQNRWGYMAAFRGNRIEEIAAKRRRGKPKDS